MSRSLVSTIWRDFRGNLSWGRICSFVALVVAVVAQFTGASVAHVATWIGLAGGNYIASKASEASCVKSGESGKTLI